MPEKSFCPTCDKMHSDGHHAAAVILRRESRQTPELRSALRDRRRRTKFRALDLAGICQRSPTALVRALTDQRRLRTGVVLASLLSFRGLNFRCHGSNLTFIVY